MFTSSSSITKQCLQTINSRELNFYKGGKQKGYELASDPSTGALQLTKDITINGSKTPVVTSLKPVKGHMPVLELFVKRTDIHFAYQASSRKVVTTHGEFPLEELTSNKSSTLTIIFNAFVKACKEWNK